MDNPNFGYIKKNLEKTLGDQNLKAEEELRNWEP